MASQSYVTDVVVRSPNTVIIFDCVLSVNTDATSRVTSHPVESGIDIADHRVNENIKVSIKGIVAAIAHKVPRSPTANPETIDKTIDITTTKTNNLPFSLNLAGVPGIINTITGKEVEVVKAPVTIQVSQGAQTSLSPADARDRVFEMRNGDDLLEVVTPTARYDNMVITRISEPRDASHGGALGSNIASWEVTLDFEQVRVRQTGTARVPVDPSKEDKASEVEGKGNTEAVEEPDSLFVNGIKESINSFSN